MMASPNSVVTTSPSSRTGTGPNRVVASSSSALIPEIDAEIEVAVGLVGLVNFDLFERGHYAVRATALFDKYARFHTQHPISYHISFLLLCFVF